jgi:hypothetical protein
MGHWQHYGDQLAIAVCVRNDDRRRAILCTFLASSIMLVSP